MKQLHILSVVPDNIRFIWETQTFLYNLRRNGYSDKAQILFFCPKSRIKTMGWNPDIDVIAKQFPEAKIFKYEDEDNIERTMGIFNYIPLLRPYTLHKHFKAHPELSKGAIFYCDTDILFLKKLDFTPFLSDDVNYLSWTGNTERTSNYIWSDYFDEKIKDVLPHKLKTYQQTDVLDITAKLCGINRNICVRNRLNTGGAQYLLKNVDAFFWEKMLNDCCSIRNYLHRETNPMFFESEDKGFQSWCADMWALLYNLWYRGYKTECPKELDFAWATDEIALTSDKYILHNAGVTSDATIRRVWDKQEVDAPAFFKGAYNTKSPFDEESVLNTISTHPISSLYFTSLISREILDTKNHLNL